MHIWENRVTESETSWQSVQPAVNSEAEFHEIAGDFGNPLEIVREALSNAFDAMATDLRILFDVRQIDGAPTLVIEFEDNGLGMTPEVLRNSFWGLGYSTSRDDIDKIGEKGHGTKIFLRSEEIRVKTQTKDSATESICERPMRSLANGKMHEPRIRQIDKWKDTTGTFIQVIGYNLNERSQFSRDLIRDYIFWFTKFGSIEKLVGKDSSNGLKIRLQCLGERDYDTLEFGHKFPVENLDGEALLKEHGANAADYFVKRYIEADQSLDEMPEVSYDIIISVEGDQIKRDYNPLIKDRRRKNKGTYKVSDRYGMWICKDYIPIERINDWIVGFGSGSNSYTLLHGFINCQSLKLTANRGSIANTSPKVLEELRKAFQTKLEEVDNDLSKKGIFTLFEWQSEQRTLSQEKGDFEIRRKAISNRKTAQFEGRTLREPSNESELFGLFMTIYALKPELFDFEPVDYNTTRGIDMLCRNKTGNDVTEAEYWYVELKLTLREILNHGFKYLRYILCWDMDKNITSNTEFGAVSETEARFLETNKTPNGNTVYYLNSKFNARKVEVIKLREFLREKCQLEFVLDKN
jgi:hypothetical protein